MAKEVKPENAEKSSADFSPKVRYHFLFAVQGLWGMVNRWLYHGCRETPEEPAQYLIAFIIETYEAEPDCQSYKKNQSYPYHPCFIKPGYEF